MTNTKTVTNANISKELVAASATPIVLAILRRADSYGYAIIQKVREVSDDRLSWTDGMLYPVLHRLEDAGFVESRWQIAANGRRRKYYRLTPAGEAELERVTEHWAVVNHALERLAGGRLAPDTGPTHERIHDV